MDQLLSASTLSSPLSHFSFHQPGTEGAPTVFLFKSISDDLRSRFVSLASHWSWYSIDPLCRKARSFQRYLSVLRGGCKIATLASFSANRSCEAFKLQVGPKICSDGSNFGVELVDHLPDQNSPDSITAMCTVARHTARLDVGWMLLYIRQISPTGHCQQYMFIAYTRIRPLLSRLMFLTTRLNCRTTIERVLYPT